MVIYIVKPKKCYGHSPVLKQEGYIGIVRIELGHKGSQDLEKQTGTAMSLQVC